MTAKDNGDGTYSLGARVTGQAGFPFVYGAPLAYNTTHNVVIEADLVSGGTSNDVIKLFVDPASSDPAVLATTTPYLTETYTSGTGPTHGAGRGDPVAVHERDDGADRVHAVVAGRRVGPGDADARTGRGDGGGICGRQVAARAAAAARVAGYLVVQTGGGWMSSAVGEPASLRPEPAKRLMTRTVMSWSQRI